MRRPFGSEPGEQEARAGVGGLGHLWEPAHLREVDPADQPERAGAGHEHVHRRAGGHEVRIGVLDPLGGREGAHHDPAADAGEQRDDEPGGEAAAQLRSTPRPDRSHSRARIEAECARIGRARCPGGSPTLRGDGLGRR